MKNLLKIINKILFYFSEIFIKKIIEIDYNNNKMLFVSMNKLTNYRIKTFSEKEPDTLKWIDSFSNNSCLWDIGANVGLYSIYASKSKNCKVYAFEPSVFNLEILAKNINLNSMQKNISVIPLAINSESIEGSFNMSSTDKGHANSSFGSNYGFDGKPFKVNFEFSTISISIDDAFKLFKLELPDYIKIDVDGIEHLVLLGGKETLRGVKEVLIELPGIWEDQTLISNKLLLESGLKLVKDHDYNQITNPLVAANQIWKRL